MSIFKLNKKSWGQVKQQILNDVGEAIEEEFRDEFSHLKDYYGSSRLVETIIFDKTAKVVGSEEWGVAASDTGQEWNWSKMPPINKIAEWVRDDKDGGIYSGAPDSIVNNIAYKVAMKIKREGIDSSFWVDDRLLDYVVDHGDNGSGRE